MTPQPDVAEVLGGFDLCDGASYAADPQPLYARLREHAPVLWDERNQLWAISRYHDIVAIEKDPVTFTSAQGYRPNLPADGSLTALDDPAHTARRRLVSRRFTPRAVASHEDEVRAVVTSLLDAVASAGTCDAVTDLAAPLPAIMIGRLLGFDHALWPALRDWSRVTVGAGGGPRYVTDEVERAAAQFTAATLEQLRRRRTEATDDCLGDWAAAAGSGCPMTDDDVISDALVVLDGGAETSLHTIAGAILLLSEHPDQRDLLVEDPSLLPVAIEEFMRYLSPLLNMRRTATRDVELRGRQLREGDQVLLLYPAANRDDAVFDDPHRFDVTRTPNHHLAFGFGTHYCLGASLARLEMRVFFEELLRRMPDIRVAPGVTPAYVSKATVRGLASLPVVFTPERAPATPRQATGPA